MMMIKCLLISGVFDVSHHKLPYAYDSVASYALCRFQNHFSLDFSHIFLGVYLFSQKSQTLSNNTTTSSEKLLKHRIQNI